MEQRYEARPEQGLAQRIGERLADIFWHKPYDILELVIPVPVLLVCLQLGNPYVATFASSPTTYRAMAATAPEQVWAVFGVCFVLLEWFATVFERRVLRVVVPGLLLVLLLMVAVMIGLANPSGTGWANYGGLAVTTGVLAVRSTKDLLAR